jgi:hypothetical protein
MIHGPYSIMLEIVYLLCSHLTAC